MTDYVTTVEALAIHADQIERYGGSAGVRDPGLLNLYETGASDFARLSRWLRDNVAYDATE
jgi:hypothetical protein